jgi:predicted lysophospholipase L1 biosynthesis ABC-type transport system permease subunit
MKEKDVYAELSSIRNLMERSSKFISLSGLSGVLAGLYALTGAALAYWLINKTPIESAYGVDVQLIYWQLVPIALVVLAFSILTACWLTTRNARAKGENVWNPVSRKLLVSIAFPLITGGLFIFILLAQENYSMIASACLIFYGLALVSGSHYTFSDVRWLGAFEIVLGLIALCFPAYGLAVWAIGFGLLNILYGSIMHFKYDQ